MESALFNQLDFFFVFSPLLFWSSGRGLAGEGRYVGSNQSYINKVEFQVEDWQN